MRRSSFASFGNRDCAWLEDEKTGRSFEREERDGWLRLFGTAADFRVGEALRLKKEKIIKIY